MIPVECMFTVCAYGARLFSDSEIVLYIESSTALYYCKSCTRSYCVDNKQQHDVIDFLLASIWLALFVAAPG